MMAIFPEVHSLAKARDIEALAVAARRYFVDEGAFKPKVSAKKMLLNAGVTLKPCEVGDDAILCARDEGGRPLVVAVINTAIADECELSFLHAHLLGHLLLHIQPKIAVGEWNTAGLRELTSPYLRYLGEASALANEWAAMEAEADLFAAAVLLPRPMLLKAQDKLVTTTRLAEFFGVEPRLLFKRQQALGFASVPQQEITKVPVPTPSAPLHSDAKRTDSGIYPRSFAASSYSNLEKKTATTPAKPTESKVSTEPSRGLARIRALAKKIDSSV
jgi:Zn-dependent peptidase ImmA (M78 family)